MRVKTITYDSVCLRRKAGDWEDEADAVAGVS
jgi:hypothetical protein